MTARELCGLRWNSPEGEVAWESPDGTTSLWRHDGLTWRIWTGNPQVGQRLASLSKANRMQSGARYR